MIENYMGYTDDVCMNIFTNDQIQRMRTVLENSPRRKRCSNLKALLPPDVVKGISRHSRNDVKVHPNPAKNKLVLEFSNPANTITGIYFYDLSGSLIREVKRINDRQSTVIVDIPSRNHHILLLKL